MDRVGIKVVLERSCVVLGFDDEHLVVIGEGDVGLHGWQQCRHSIIDIPGNLGGGGLDGGMLLLVVLQDELFIELVHALFIDEGGESVDPLFAGQEHPVDDEAADTDEHAVGIVVAMEADE